MLYPWHKRLDDDFRELKEDMDEWKRQSLSDLNGGEKRRLAELLEIKECIRTLDGKRSFRGSLRPVE